MSQRVLLAKVVVGEFAGPKTYERVYAHTNASGWLIIERENGDQVWYPPQQIYRKVEVTL